MNTDVIKAITYPPFLNLCPRFRFTPPPSRLPPFRSSKLNDTAKRTLGRQLRANVLSWRVELQASPAASISSISPGRDFQTGRDLKDGAPQKDDVNLLGSKSVKQRFSQNQSQNANHPGWCKTIRLESSGILGSVARHSAHKPGSEAALRSNSPILPCTETRCSFQRGSLENVPLPLKRTHIVWRTSVCWQVHSTSFFFLPDYERWHSHFFPPPSPHISLFHPRSGSPAISL